MKICSEAPERVIGNSCIIKLAEERNYRQLMEIIRDNHYLKGDNFINEKRIIYKNPTLEENYFREMNVRFQLYNYTEEFIYVRKYSGEMKGFISFRIPQGNKLSVINLNSVIMDHDLHTIKLMIQYAIDHLPQYAIISPTKIRALIIEEENNKDQWIRLLEELQFSREYIHKNELGRNQSTIAYYINIPQNSNVEREA